MPSCSSETMSNKQIDPGGSRRSKMKLCQIFLFLVLFCLPSVTGQTREKVELKVAEEVSVNTVVGGIPIKPGFTYRFNTEEDLFSLDPISGVITTKGRIDRESSNIGKTGQFDLIVLSSSPTYPIEVVIQIEDINDHAPEFPNSVSQISFSEGSTPGSRVLLDPGVDQDQADNGRIVKYNIQSGNEDGHFKLSLSTSRDSSSSYLHLETTSPLDREKRSSYLLNITAQDGGRDPKVGSMLLTINILDINDNAPEFVTKEYIASVNESVATGSFVIQVQARDKDEGDNSRVSYYLATSGHSDQFNIDQETGVVTTNKPLSCGDNMCQLSVIARDHGSPRQDVRTNVKIVLIDANDHDPQILFRYFPDQTATFATVEENAKPGNLVSAITVTDHDKGDNGRTSVKITEGNDLRHFKLDSRGDIHIVRVDSELDRESTREYNLTVVAEDKGSPPRTSTAFLIIHVNDINDHAPVFTEDTYTSVLTEGAAIGSYVAAPLALDDDTGVNSNIYYSIVQGNDLQWFHIDHNSGLITTRMKIDREKQSEVNLEISARDGGTNPKFATATVAITIEDENDEAPVFLNKNSEGFLKLEVSENTRVGSKIATIQAVDNDRGRNGSITYQLSRGTQLKYPEYFQLDSTSGDLIVNNVLDRELIDKYDLVVFAEDGGKPSKTSTMSISIDVLDTNDNTPVFYPDRYFVVLQSDFAQEEPVVQLRATDADEGINALVEFKLIDGDSSIFSLNEQTGQILLRKPIKDISRDIYYMQVAAQDKKGRKSLIHASVEIVVESPEVQYISCTENLYKFSIAEDSSIGTPNIGRQVGTVVLQENSVSNLVFEIMDGNEHDSFDIEESGTIITSRPLDREIQEKTVLKIRVKSTTEVISAICQAEVKLEDVNDQAPKITDDVLITISEDAPIKEIVKIVTASDNDKDENSRMSYMLDDNTNDHFSINENTGAIYLEKPLKDAGSKLFYLNVFVSDHGSPSLESNFTYRLEVADVNDHTPLFDLEEYDISLPENSKVNSKVFWLKATDGDSGENGRVDYNILTGDNETFGIFPDGNLYLKMEVDREDRDYYSLEILVNDHGEPQRSSSTTMTIHITDKNDNHPKFSNRAYKFSINENEPENTFVGQIYATDKDIGRNAELTYSAEKNQLYFSVDPKTGFIVSKKVLDREMLISEFGSNSVTFEVVVSDDGLPKLSDSATVTITVNDENDNSPTFSKDTYVARVSETSPVGTEVKSIFASDADSGANGAVTYKIISGNRLKTFSINSTTGIIYLDKALDREQVADYVLGVEADDGGDGLVLTSYASLIIIVSDENDNAPVFTNEELVLTLPEDAPVGEKVFLFNAEDKDEGENAELRYFISGGSYTKHFNIDQYTGTLILQKSLDYEKDKSVSVKVTVMDRGSPSLNDTVTLKVHVTDVNDNAPRFPSTAIVRQIQEGIAVNTRVVTMDALDDDTGDNGKVEYSLAGYEAGSAEKFSIDPNTGVISTVGDIDREEIDTYRFTVVATDQAVPASSRLSAEKVITIIVEDINDNAPEFVSVPTGSITPATQLGDVIMTIQAIDKDSNSNGLVTYQLEQDSYLFSIDHYNGEITLKNQPQQYDDKYELIVIASDEAVQSERKSSKTTVTVLGLSSEQPGAEFTKEVYTGELVENDPPGTFIATVELSDADTSPDYYITDVKSQSGRKNNNLFRIDDKTGDVRTVAAIDREVHGDQFDIMVLAVVRHTGTGTKTSSCQVKVSVEDINDTPPVFEDISTIRFSEGTNPGVPIYTVRAYDADLDSVVKYSIVDGDRDTFTIDEVTGDISLLHTVDRELRETFRLSVQASDGKHQSLANLILVVQDANDNIPSFSSDIFTFDVYESAGKGSQVGKVTAVDEDKGDNAVITYDLISDWGNEVFSLNPSSGIFTLTSELDYEQEEHYRFVVSGTDSGQPRLSSTVTVYINVKDVNDNTPSFTQPLYEADVSEDTPPGSSILQLEATDLDSENNGDIEYSIIGEADEYFGIYNNGTMFSKRTLDRETKASFSFIVKATDGGLQGGRHSATASVLLTLTDVNDQPPRFTSASEGYILENQPPNTIVMSVTAEDLDEGNNADVEYFLSQSDSDNFVIGRLDGIIRTTNTLDRELRSEYTVAVTTQDHGVPALSATMVIKIVVIDDNDNTPNFDPKVYSTTVLENATIGQNILHTTAFDKDEGFNGHIRYTIVSGDKTTDFSIGEYSGVIKVNKRLDFERKNAYQLTIQAEDSGSPVRYDTASVSIYIDDVNDSPPIFLDSPYIAYVVENGSELPRYVTSLQARDKDNPPHNLVEYSIKRTFGGAFSVNGSTGDIYLHSALDRETDPHYNLEIVAVDIGNPRLSSTGTLSVLIKDENDNPPIFVQSQYTLMMNENNNPNTFLATLTATDEDVGRNGDVRYSLKGEDAAAFTIDELSGDLRARYSLNREDKDLYELIAVAEDDGEDVKLSNSAKVTIKIVDQNDNKPFLTNIISSLNIPDNIKSGDTLYKFDAVDADADLNSKIQFYLRGRDAGSFSLDPTTGLLTARKQVNVEDRFLLELEVSDSGNPAQSVQTSLTVSVSRSDLFPVFATSANQIFVEEETLGGDLPSVEANSVSGNPVQYTIAGGDLSQSFDIDPDSGKLKLVKPLDREQLETFDLYIGAFEYGSEGQTSYHKINVKVVDTNDNGPQFENDYLQAEVMEEQFPPVTVIKVTAVDADTGVNGEVKYRLLDHLDKFDIDSDSGEITTNVKLDREKQDSYDINVEAYDGGQKSLSGSAVIRVTVRDINDNHPKFTRIISINITENSPIGTKVVTVETVDKDIGDNAIVSYELAENPGNKFSINSVTGDIEVIGDLDREVQDEYLLKVVATDGAWRAETTVGINIMDQNDNSPIFDQASYTLMFPHTSTPVAVVGRVNAEDKDGEGPNSAITYKLRETSEYFSIDSSSGEIISKRRLSYINTTRSQSIENVYILSVIAMDDGKPPMSDECQIRILVTDLNTNPPVFTEADYTKAIPRFAPANMEVIQVHAEDNIDTGLNAEITYRLQASEVSQYFYIDPVSGRISLQRNLLADQSRSSYQLVVVASDMGDPVLSSSSTVTLMTSGDNLHAPQFSDFSTQVIIPENEPVGTLIIQLSATDSDSGINGIVRYYIVQGNQEEKFKIDDKSGKISINKPLDFDDENEYNLTIQAIDLAFTPKNSVSVLKIILTDVNDNVPFFERPQYDAYLQENSPAGSSIIKMNAIDYDSPRYADILYQIEEEKMKQYFTINMETGVVTSNLAFDYEKYSEYSMHVVVSNPGSAGFNRTKLNVHITGSNEYHPRFQQPVFQFAVSESASVDTAVGQIHALDQDQGKDGEVFYFLIGNSNDRGFHINKRTGVITVQKSLDRESQNRFVLTVLAKNRGSIQGNDTDEAQVIIQVQDGNDPPVFIQHDYRASVLENVQVGSTVVTVEAVDKDVRPRNSQFSYSIIDGNQENVFEIDPSSGSIRTTEELDREAQDLHSLVVAATDNGTPPQTGTAMVSINVEDVNDNPPSLDAASRHAVFRENSPRNTLVARILPTDSDLPPNTGPFKFYISDHSENGDYFEIDENTGEIRSRVSNIDREQTPSLSFMLEIHDSGVPSLSDTYPFTIDISDENDNPSEPRILTVIVQTLNGDFTGGTVAPVKPKDPDTSGDYVCDIKQGPTNIFQMRPNCELTSGRLMNVAGYNLTVEGSDGLHDSVTSQVYITFDKFEERAKDQSIIIRAVNSPDMELQQVFKHINFHTSKAGSVQILSMSVVDNFTDFFVTLRSPNGRYVEKEQAVEILRGELDDVIVGYSVCQDSPCQNQGVCSSKINVMSETVIVEAGDIILNSPKFLEDWSCQCQENFEGESCQLKSNPCENPNPCEAGGECIQEGYNFRCLCPPHRTGERCHLERSSSCDRNPCQNGGTCRESNLGDFFCLCRPGFQGANCQIALDPCQPNPCQNGGECLSKRPNYQCKCPDNYYGTNCEKSTFGFGELSFMTFPALDPNTNDISITFSTTRSNCLLVYNYGEATGGRSDFIAVELINGKATFSFGGARTAVTKISVNKYLANGRWFKVTATRNNRVASLSVEDCTESGEYCKQCLAGDESCFTKDIGDTGTLNFNNNFMFFGGIDHVQPILVRPDQVQSDDFVGCMKSLLVNGQQMNLKSSFLTSSGILSFCPIAGELCQDHDCGPGECTEVDWRPVCVCPGGVMAQDCDRSISPIALTQNATVNFEMSEKLQRMQLLGSSSTSNDVSFTFRTEDEEGKVFSSGNSNDYTQIYVEQNKLVYETKKSGFPRINITSDLEVTDGAWHVVIIKQTQQILQVYLDDAKLDEDLETGSTHNLLDPYLMELQFGGRRKHGSQAFRGCLRNFTINNEAQSWYGGSNLLQNVSFSGTVLDDCLPNFLSITAGNDPINVGIIIVVIFFIILIFAILGSFFIFKRKKKYEKMQNRSAAESHANQGFGMQTKSYEDGARRQKKMTSHQKPDVIEREMVNASPLGDYSRHDLPDYSASMVMQEPDAPEHYDLENASSIAPSDIDVIYHYKGYRDQSRSGPIRLSSLAVGNNTNNKLQSTPLARLSPSSEMSHQTPRILTLQDISGKQPLQSALLQTHQGRHSGRSLQTPMSHLTDSSGSDLNSSARARRQRRHRKKPGMSSSEELDRMARNSSLVNTMDGVSNTSSGRKSKTKFNDLLETNTEQLHDDNSSSDSPSENDSFTCSEYDYEAPYEGGNKQLDHSQNGTGGMVFRKLNNFSDSDRPRSEGRRGSLTTLNVSDDDLSLSGFASSTGPASWESLLNWSPNFNTFVGVFKDIAELPDMDSDERPNPLGDRDDEEYI